jgi:hypothetical protein
MTVELADDALWAAFHDRTLAAAAWTHAAHVRVAWLHLARYELAEAHLRMRAGILRLNAAHGLVETPQRGYHETLTWAWLAIVADARATDPGADSRAFAAAHAIDREAPLRYYTRARLFSLEARARFVPPDRAPLPGE